jgi:hypothetical protein
MRLDNGTILSLINYARWVNRTMMSHMMTASGLFAVAIAGCMSATFALAQSHNGAASTSRQNTSWDGTYTGNVEITGLGSRVQRRWCDTNPQIVLHVINDTFSYSMPHPNAPKNPSPVYEVKIAPDGTFSNNSGTGTMSGKIVVNRMSGTINGSLCTYAFVLNRP